MTVGRVSQAAAEVLLQAAPKAWLSQHSAEILLQAVPRARLGQQAVEVLLSFTNTTVASPRRPALILCIAA